MTTNKPKTEKIVFTPYQKTVILILALTQFTVILDFMIINPISDLLMKSNLALDTTQLGVVVAAYAFSAGISGVLVAGFADKYDRKKLLIFFYSGFFLGTLFCGLAPTYELLVTARIVTGIFAGVVSSVSMAIITDLFPLNVRGRVMGFVQMSFVASNLLGIPLGIWLAYMAGWYFPFILIAFFILIVWIFIGLKLKPVDEHLKIKSDKNAFLHLWKTVKNKTYLQAFLASCLLPIGGYLLMPFGNPFVINNLNISPDSLPLISVIGGVCAIGIMPLVGKLSDTVGKLRMLYVGTVLASVMVIIYTQLENVPVWELIILNALMFTGIMSRMVPTQAIITAIPEPADRGAFMSINSSLQNAAGGIASIIGGYIVVQKTKTSPIEHYDTLGYVCVGVMVFCAVMMYFVNRSVVQRTRANTPNI